VRDRSSYAFALVSVAAALEVGADGTIADVRLALAAWRTSRGAPMRRKAVLRGAPADDSTFRRAAEAELTAARRSATTASSRTGQAHDRAVLYQLAGGRA